MNPAQPTWPDNVAQAIAQPLNDGHAVDAVIARLLLELALLRAWQWRTGRGLPAGLLLPNLAGGLCLMLALRSVLAGQSPAWTAADLHQRWRQVNPADAINAALPAQAGHPARPSDQAHAISLVRRGG